MIADPAALTTLERLSTALDEFDVIRGQLREARSSTRTSRFYRLVRLRPLVDDGDVHPADVIELSGGWVLVHWLHDPHAVSMYSSINSVRIAFAGVFQLVLDDVSERRVETRPHHDQPLGGTALGALDRRVLRLVRLGLTNKQIAQRLQLANTTVKNRLSQVYVKLGVADRIGAVLLTHDWDLDESQQSAGD